MNDDKLDETIKCVENFFFSDDEQRKDKERDSGEKLFIDFAEKNRQIFLNSKLTTSTENKFEFTELHREFQSIYESKLEELINQTGISVEEFYDGLSRRCEEGDQNIILFVDLLNQIVDYNSFMEMMANLIYNKETQSDQLK